MMFSLFLSLSYFIAMCSMNSIKPESSEEVVPEGGNIKLSCKYEGSINNIQWFQQKQQRSRPEFLLLITEDGFISAEISGFSAHINKTDKRVDLKIISAKVTDSAVYYCAVRPNTQGGYKLIFGRGTRLNIETNDKYAPSYFYLENQQSSACLAAGFSPHNATLTHQLFKKDPTKAEPVQISGDSLFNQVALVSEGQGDTCDPNRNKTSVCAGTLDKDPTVNSVTLIVLALRLLFFKTVVFNVLMTLRLWMSL